MPLADPGPILAATTASTTTGNVTIALPILIIAVIVYLIVHRNHGFGAAFLAFVLGVITAGAVISGTVAHAVVAAIAGIAHAL